MTKLEQIEKSVSELSPEGLQALASWFDDLQAKRWDAQFETDAASSRLDALANNALAEFATGKSRPL